jgi:hypothetical protein
MIVPATPKISTRLPFLAKGVDNYAAQEKRLKNQRPYQEFQYI